MTVELGHFALILAFAVAAAQCAAGFALWRSGGRIVRFVRNAALLQFVLVAVSFAALTQAFVTSDFSVALAYEHSHQAMPLIYKYTSVWGNHEGSMLLWVLILVTFGAAVAAFGTRLPGELQTLVMSVQGGLTAAFTGFTIFTSNPFERLDPAPLQGKDLNPILQDIGLAIHPPLLYLGYVGLSVCFGFAVAALVSGRIDAAWARWVRPWTLASWTFLTLGIAMGSYWAYYELGWGGWWFWDPVENASFMPWLAATALLHSALVMEKRNALKVWTIFLAILAFSLSLLGTFLVRSGILTSVHSFASDPTRGIAILGLLTFIIGAAFVLFALRASTLRTGGLFAPISREGALILNNLFLATGVAAVFVGTLYPLLLEALTGQLISVGEPFFNLTFGILMAPLLVIIPFGPFLPWKRADLVSVTKRMTAAVLAALGVWLIALILTGAYTSLAGLGLLLGIWVCVGALADLVDRARFGHTSLSQSLRRLTGLPRTAYSTALAHFGLGVTVIGIVSVSAWETERIASMQVGDQLEISGYSLELISDDRVQGPNYVSDDLTFDVVAPGGGTRRTVAEKRVYTTRGMPTTEAGILTYGVSQLYVSLGDRNPDGSWVVRVWHKPLVILIWLGAVFMAGAGTISLSDRRLRIGVPQKSGRPSAEPAR